MSKSLKLAILLAWCAAITSCGSDPEKAPASATQAAGRQLTLQRSETAQWTPVGAQVATRDQAQALARIPGILVELNVHEGDFVRQGEPLGRVVDNSLGFQSGALGAQAAAAQAQAAQAEAELARSKYLFDNGVYAQARLDKAQAVADAARALVRAAREQQNSVKAVAGQGVVRAPASGRVLIADVPAGSAVAPGMPIATITAGPVVLRLDLPESLAASIRPGAAVIVDMGDGGERRGTVRQVYPSVIAGQVRADADVPGLDAGLIGRRMAARVESGQHTGLLVPEDYVSTRFGIDYVTLRTADGAGTSVPVQTAPAGMEGMVEILSGVSAGDVLVAGGSDGAAA